MAKKLREVQFKEQVLAGSSGIIDNSTSTISGGTIINATLTNCTGVVAELSGTMTGDICGNDHSIEGATIIMSGHPILMNGGTICGGTAADMFLSGTTTNSGTICGGIVSGCILCGASIVDCSGAGGGALSGNATGNIYMSGYTLALNNGATLSGGTICGASLCGCTGAVVGEISGVSGRIFIDGDYPNMSGTVKNTGIICGGTVYGADIENANVCGGTICGASLCGCTGVTASLSGKMTGNICGQGFGFYDATIYMSGRTIYMQGGVISNNNGTICGGTICGANLSNCTGISSVLMGSLSGNIYTCGHTLKVDGGSVLDASAGSVRLGSYGAICGGTISQSKFMCGYVVSGTISGGGLHIGCGGEGCGIVYGCGTILSVEGSYPYLNMSGGTICGGTICGATLKDCAGVVAELSGTMTGDICGNDHSIEGATIYMSGHPIFMNGGTIFGGTAADMFLSGTTTNSGTICGGIVSACTIICGTICGDQAAIMFGTNRYVLCGSGDQLIIVRG